MRQHRVDAVILGTSLFAAVALLGAAVSSLDAGGDGAQLVGAPARPSALTAPAPLLDATQAEQALAPFEPPDAHSHAATPALAAIAEEAGHVHGAESTQSAGTADGHDHGTGTGAADGHEHGTGSDAAGGHDHGGDAENAQTIVDGDNWEGGPFEGQRIQWEPAAEGRGSAMRIVREGDEVHLYSPTDEQCAGVTPTQAEVDVASGIVNDTRAALERYHNRPDLALADGFVPYPLGNRYWHMINLQRVRTSSYTTGDDSEVLNPDVIESFIYGMVDGLGLYAIGGMYMYDQKDAVPPAPFGCLTSWHMHTGSQGFITSFDLEDQRSVWMFHVWNLDVVGPWGEHDGTDTSDWWLGWRYLPSVCTNDDCIA